MNIFDQAPENVRKLAMAILESLGPTGIPEISPRSALICGEHAGLNAAEYIAAIRWLAGLYASHLGADRSQLAKQVANLFENFAVELEREAKRMEARAACASTT